MHIVAEAERNRLHQVGMTQDELKLRVFSGTGRRGRKNEVSLYVMARKLISVACSTARGLEYDRSSDA